VKAPLLQLLALLLLLLGRARVGVLGGRGLGGVLTLLAGSDHGVWDLEKKKQPITYLFQYNLSDFQGSRRQANAHDGARTPHAHARACNHSNHRAPQATSTPSPPTAAPATSASLTWGLPIPPPSCCQPPSQRT